ncbi:hypothetical protein DRO38_06985 [Candidatus Bathyarchaeota archaeon]|nr:MAG: hypothetical protein DRO38_06985 [Candidatus Bathyarchaeota archaeon]
MEKMKIKTIGVLLIAGLVVLLAMMVFAAPASACEIEFVKFNGTITYPDGSGVEGVTVEIKKQSFWPFKWTSMGSNVTNSSGYYEIGRKCGYTFVCYRNDTYRMFIDGNLVGEQYIDDWKYDRGGNCSCFTWSFWSYQWNYQIPEFATIAIPAVAILGLFLFYSHRKRKEE